MYVSLLSALPASIFLVLGGWLSVIDVKTHRLPNRIVASLTITLLLVELVIDQRRTLQAVGIAILSLVTYSVLYILSRGQLGMGDVKFSFPIGLFIGWYLPDMWLATIFVAFISAGIFGLILSKTQNLNLSSRIPLGPFMYLGTFAAVAQILIN